ncbi:Prefoldin subunit-domain-containing protein [Cantharellus anzutake]|uniref:Prefoldin subunit-domain-containing protein n=1 Tax=Cantharellus anzutake TaxID=1750568 RepID=UPI001904CFC3|nr:Prefoldin subunit-domain-containing protein [Cantharellus anzutake]KAF8342279.1 Prefoldin subunit-domain-containing protein [Cantharellus anzutake]
MYQQEEGETSAGNLRDTVAVHQFDGSWKFEMRMLTPAEEETDAPEVDWEDQQRINTFSKLNTRCKDLEEDLEKKKEDREALDDLSTELETIELMDEGTPVLYRVGEAFLHVPVGKAQKMMVADQECLAREINALQIRLDDCIQEMKSLKATLYAKFGKAINLD